MSSTQPTPVTVPAVAGSEGLGYHGLPGHPDGMVGADGAPRACCEALAGYLRELGLDGLGAVQRDAEVSLLNQGITFTVYADERGTEKIFPLDVIPRIVTAASGGDHGRGVLGSQRLAEFLHWSALVPPLDEYAQIEHDVRPGPDLAHAMLGGRAADRAPSRGRDPRRGRPPSPPGSRP